MKISTSILIVLAFILFGNDSYSQLTINVISVPANTGDDNIFLASNYNNWNPGDTSYILNNNGNGTYQITFTPGYGNLLYKFTRGNWSSVEGGPQGQEISNRMVFYSGNQQRINVSILSWKDKISGNSTKADNVIILNDNFFMPQLNRTRKIWVYVPPGYENSQERYPVLYMQDGQNLFDRSTSFAGEWEIDETLNTLFDMGDSGVIVVGIDNGGEKRIDEYSPWINNQYGGGEGDKYADFIVETLKPFIDSTFRTKPDRLNTGIMGSSLGALISFYTAIEHQDIFSKIGVFSPSFWFSGKVYPYVVNTGKKHKMRIYMIGGKQESESLVENMKKMIVTLKSAGFDDSEIKMIINEDGQHSEWYWRREFKKAYLWLYKKELSSSFPNADNPEIDIFPNPFTDTVKISNAQKIPDATINVYSNYGTLEASFQMPENGVIVMSNYKKGIYIFQIIYKNKKILSKKLIHLDSD